MSDDLAKRLAEQILTDSSLTDDLDDTEANRLLDWALVLVKELARTMSASYSAGSEEYLDGKMYSLRRTVRGINSLVGTLSDLEDERVVKKLKRLFERAAELPGLEIEAPPDLPAAAQSMRGQTPEAVLSLVLGYFTLPGEAEPDVFAGMADMEQASSDDDQTSTQDASGGTVNDP